MKTTRTRADQVRLGDRVLVPSGWKTVDLVWWGFRKDSVLIGYADGEDVFNDSTIVVIQR